jgi:hypothetical protein
MTRQEALKAAQEFVDGLAPRTNGRGYTDGCLDPQKRITEVLRVADWLLLGSDEATPEAPGPACGDCGSARGDVVLIQTNTDGTHYWRHAYGFCDTFGARG